MLRTILFLFQKRLMLRKIPLSLLLCSVLFISVNIYFFVCLFYCIYITHDWVMRQKGVLTWLVFLELLQNTSRQIHQNFCQSDIQMLFRINKYRIIFEQFVLFLPLFVRSCITDTIRSDQLFLKVIFMSCGIATQWGSYCDFHHCFVILL